MNPKVMVNVSRAKSNRNLKLQMLVKIDALDHSARGAASTLQLCGYTKTDCMIALVASNLGFA